MQLSEKEENEGRARSGPGPEPTRTPLSRLAPWKSYGTSPPRKESCGGECRGGGLSFLVIRSFLASVITTDNSERKINYQQTSVLYRLLALSLISEPSFSPLGSCCRRAKTKFEGAAVRCFCCGCWLAERIDGFGPFPIAPPCFALVFFPFRPQSVFHFVFYCAAVPLAAGPGGQFLLV